MAHEPIHDQKKRQTGAKIMPEITVSMAAGRTDDQKAGMMRDITQALVKNLGVDSNDVVIQINEAPLAHKMKGGKTFVERRAAMQTKGPEAHFRGARSANRKSRSKMSGFRVYAGVRVPERR